MITVIAVIAGGCYSAAFVAPKPYCYIAAVLAALGAIIVRRG
jgi:hypothetical protein